MRLFQCNPAKRSQITPVIKDNAGDLKDCNSFKVVSNMLESM